MIQFTHPGYLLLLPPLIYLAWRISKASMADMSRGRRKFSLGLRILIVTMVVLAVSGLQFVRSSRHLAVIFVLDISDSIPSDKRDAALDYIRQSLANKREGDYAGLVVFGADASVEFAPDKVTKIDSIRSVPSTAYTDIAQGVGLAIASFPEDASKRIVLLSDGNENLGKALDQAAMAESGGITIDTVPIANDLPKEVLLDRMIAPGEVKIGEPFELKLIASSKSDAHASIRLLRSGRPVGLKPVTLTPGKNVLTFPQTIDKPGVYSFEAIIENCDADTMPDNNRALGSTMVRGKPRVLYVEGKEGQAASLATALKSSDIEVHTRPRSGVPTSVEELREYDSVIFSDVPAMALIPEQMKMIEAGVRDLGIGFGMIGGDESFGAGGYFETPIERTLPVDMSIRKQKSVPSLSVVIVIDKSGSMSADENGRTKISLANEAAVNVVKLLQPIDKVGVIFCHDFPVTTVALTPATSKEAIGARISTITAEGGGITVFPSLKAAYRMIVGSGTRQRHVIMLCDGADCDQQPGCVSMAEEMNKKGITVTSVAIGDGPDVPFLKQMAAAGGGNFYLARYARELPYIFTKDVMLISKTLIIEEPFKPQVVESSAVLSGIDWGSAPPLLGYVATSPKPMAEVPVISHKEDPVYAQWQYGLGRSIAFTSDAKPRWAVRWIGWPGFNKFWAQSVRWSMRKTGKGDFQTLVDIDQAVGRVTVDAVDETGKFVNFLQLEGRVIPPDMKSIKLKLEQTAPGRYEAEFPARQVGTYTVNVVEKRKDATLTQTSTLSIPYPPEYKDIQTNKRLLERLAKMTQGRVAPAPAQVFAPNAKDARIPSDMWWTLTLLAAVLFPLDVAVRRLAMDASEVRELAAKGVRAIASKRAAFKRRAASSVEEGTISDLLKAKTSRKERDDDRREWVRDSIRSEVEKRSAKPKDPAPAAKREHPTDSVDTTSRLLEAKRRAREKRDE